MSLTETLKSMKAASRAKIPSETVTIMGRAIEQLEKSGIVNMALKPGEKAPSFTLSDTLGESHSSEVILIKGPMILTFYRGSW